MVANTPQLNARILLKRADVRLYSIGSQANTLVAADLHNTIRYMGYLVGDSYKDSTINALTDIFRHPDTSRLLKPYFDKTHTLATQAFDDTNYNSPQIRAEQFSFPINTIIDCFTPVAAGSSGWDTKMGNLLLDIVSDSAVTPNPAYSINIRIYYDYLDI